MLLHPQNLTIPTLTHDYPEWHQGREDYALWYVEIHQPELVEYLDHLRQIFFNELLQPNIRQFHITLFVCGFLTHNELQFDDDFSEEQLKQQIELLKQMNFESFKLTTGMIRSFDSALFVEVFDPEDRLSKIRNQFYKVNSEPAALNYLPHITLGLYHSEMNAAHIFSKISEVEQKTFEIKVSHLTFATYKAKVLQGLLYAKQYLHLDSKTAIGQCP